MKKAQRFEELIVWQLSRELVNLVYEGSDKWRDYSLKDQIRRAAVSVVSNIAEGFERGTKEEFLYFLYIARGSCGEVRAQLYVALDQKFVAQSEFEKIFDKADHTSRMIAKFIAGYKDKGTKGQKFVTPVNKEKEAFEKYVANLVPKEYRIPK